MRPTSTICCLVFSPITRFFLADLRDELDRSEEKAEPDESLLCTEQLGVLLTWLGLEEDDEPASEEFEHSYGCQRLGSVVPARPAAGTRGADPLTPCTNAVFAGFVLRPRGESRDALLSNIVALSNDRHLLPGSRRTLFLWPRFAAPAPMQFTASFCLPFHLPRPALRTSLSFSEFTFLNQNFVRFFLALFAQFLGGASSAGFVTSPFL